MSTFTPRLQLKRPDGSDPFLRQDFVDNFNKMDAAPGTHVCTSTSRPAWGTAQAGRLILETDTRTQWEWSGTAWLPILTATSAWVLGSAMATYMASGAATTYALGSVVTTRPGTLVVDTSVIVASVDVNAQSCSAINYIAGVVASGGNPTTGFQQWTGSNNNGSINVYETMRTIGYKAVGPGTHTIAVRVAVGTLSSQSVLAYRAGATITLVNETSR